MKRRVMCFLCAMLLIGMMLTSCADAPRTISMANAKAESVLEKWNEEQNGFYLYSGQYNAAEKEYVLTMRAIPERDTTMMSRSIVQEMVEPVYRTLRDKCFGNRPDVSVRILVYGFGGVFRYTYNGKTLQAAD